MANTLRFKRGLVSTIPTALAGEPLFTTDTFDLYIGNGTTNTRFQKYIASGTTSQLLRGDGSLLTMPIVLTSPSTGQVLKYNGTSWVNDSDAGITGSGASGQVAYFTGATTQSGSNNLFWDNTNGRLGIGTNVPDNRLQVVTNGTKSTIAIGNQLSGTYPQLLLYGGLNKYNWSVGAQYNVNNAFEITPSTAIDGTTFSTPAITIFSNGNFGVNRTTDNGLRFQVTGDGYFSGSVGIGTSTLTGFALRIDKTITGAAASYGVAVVSNVQSTVTNGRIFYSEVGTQAATFTLNELQHFFAVQGVFGAGSTVTNQYGFRVLSNMTGATNNYGFFGDIASGTGRWNLYMNGSAQNFVQGSLGIGVAIPTTKLDVFDTVTTQLRVRMSGQADMRIISDTGYGALSLESNMPMVFRTNATERMRLDASGNLGLGVVPSAWAAGYKALQVLNLSLFGTSSLDLNLGSNVYYDGVSYKYIANGFASLYNQYLGKHYWNTAASGTAGNAITFTQAMTLDASGNLGVGTTNPGNDRLSVVGSGRFTQGLTSSTAFQQYAHYFYNGGGTNDIFASTTGNNAGSGNFAIVNTVGGARIGLLASSTGSIRMGNNTQTAASATDFVLNLSTGNISINSGTDAGYKLDVNGTMRVSGASTLNATTTIQATGNAYANGNLILKNSTGASSVYLTNANGIFYLSTNGTNDHFQINSTGAATFSSSVTAGGRTILAAGYIADLSGSGNDVGIVFSSSGILSSTGAGALAAKNLGSSANPWGNLWAGAATFSSTAQAAGFITSGGAGYAVINSAANTVTALRPTGGGASIMSTNSNGLHIAVGTQAAGDLILASNNTERIRLSSNGFFSQLNATNPSASITDSYIQYSADVTAGNAAPHFRTENGAVIKLYQETTGVGNSIISLGGGNAVLDDTTFDGYTLRQIVKALRNQGILA